MPSVPGLLRNVSLMGACILFETPAQAQSQAETIQAMQRQIDDLRAQIQELSAAMTQRKAAAPANPPIASEQTSSTAAAPPVAVAAAAAAPVAEKVVIAPPATSPERRPKPAKAWYERLQLRGYAQLRVNENLASPSIPADGASRFRSVQDSAIAEDSNFSFRRLRLVVQGDISERVGIYVQSDFAASVTNQSGGERREHFAQLRDAYADIHFADRSLKLRVGQSKVPFGWENLQSSSNRLSFDRADAANSAVPGERDLGVVAYYTPLAVQAIWNELAADGHKLFGNYGAFGLGLFNGQGTNRTEKNNGLMKVAMITWPFRLDGLGGPFTDQVAEIGIQGLHNSVRPELRSGGVTAVSFDERRVNLHAMLYPAPFGFQTEWTWGRGPEWNPAAGAMTTGNLSGGYVQVMYRIGKANAGSVIPYARWQTYRGGWKAAVNAPRVATDEMEFGVEWQPLKELELTVAYADSKRSEADERRTGQAAGHLLRAQLQWNY